VQHVTTWLNVELPRVQNRRADLVGKFASGAIVHIEIQSENDPEMAMRMAEYALFIFRTHKQYPQQLVLYVGNARLAMVPGIETQGLSFRYNQLDIRTLNGTRLLDSARFSDNVLSVLARLDDVHDGIARILKRIGNMKRKSDREAALSLLFQAAQLRDLQDTVSEELQKMPIIVKTSINDKTFGPWIRKGMAKGAQRMLRLQLEKRFGVLPAAVDKRLASITETEAEKLALALMDAKSLDELFPAESGKQ
jgi:hypothetical protein